MLAIDRESVFSAPRSIALRKISKHGDFLDWVSSDLLGPAARVWAEAVFPATNFDVEKALDGLANVCPDAILMRRATVVSKDYVSREFLLTHDGMNFLDITYLLLLGRQPDASGRTTFEKTSYTKDEKNFIINAIIESEEYVNVFRPELLDETLERIEGARIQNLRNSVLFRSAAVPQSFFERGIAPYELCSGRAVYSLLHRSGSATLLTPGMVSFCEMRGTSISAQQGWIITGPKCTVRAGTFRVRLSIDNPRDLALSFDICHGHGTSKVCGIDFSGSASIDLLFSLPIDVRDLEFRLRGLESRSGEIRIERFEVQRDEKVVL